MSDDFKVQVSLKTRAGTLINLRGQTTLDVDVHLEELAKLAPRLAEIETLFEATSAFQGAGMVRGAGGPPAQQQSAPQHSQQQGPPEPASKKFCAHGKMTWITDTAKKSGNVYSAWKCLQGCKNDKGYALMEFPDRG